MAKEKLNPRKVATLTQPGWHGDGQGLWFQIKHNGSRAWAFRYMFQGKPRIMGLGPYPNFSLAEARTKAADARKILKDPDNPRDPLEVRRERQQAAKLSRKEIATFDEVARRYIAAHRSSWTNPKHAAQWESTLQRYASPKIGNTPVSAITTDDVLQTLEPIWHSKTETASRVRQRIENILDYATARKLRSGENPARWRGHLDKLLPKPSKVAKKEHHAALAYAGIGGFMSALRTHSGIGAAAFEFAILTASRTGEVIGAKWQEFDLQAEQWTIPAERMKANKEHVIPLSSRALEILQAMQGHQTEKSPYVFHGVTIGKHISSGAFLQILKRMNRKDITPHGFRSTFRDWAGESTSFPREVIEHALAHQLKDKAEAAYQRGTLLKKRAKLMQAWADQCNAPDSASATVTPIRAGTA